MTKKSYITLCIVGILYIVMASTAILSPHGNGFSLAAPGEEDKNNIVPGMNDQFADIDSKVTITNSTGAEVDIPILSMPALNGTTIEYTDAESEETTSFTAVKIARVITFSALKVSGDTVTLTDSADKTYTIPAEEFIAADNTFLAYADADKQPLGDDYGYFCLIVKEGESAGIYKDIAKISLG